MSTFQQPSMPPTQNQPPRKRRRWPWIVGVLAALVVAGAVIAGTLSQGGRQSAYSGPVSAQPDTSSVKEAASVTIPQDLEGTDVGSATTRLTQLGLIVTIDDPSGQCNAYIATVTVCTVTGVPDAGRAVDAGSSVTLDVEPDPTSTTDDLPPAPTTDTVIYKVTGHRAGDITYTNATGDISQVTNTTRLPWSYKFTSDAGAEDFMSVSAQNAGSGSISCSISINGTVIKQNTSTGAYAIATCSS